jgi:DNA-binding YbaB/EbfC family protein
MFKELGQIMGLAKQLPKIKEEMDRLQQRLAQVSAEGDAGAGMVKVRVNGKQEVVACTISDEAFKAGDREVLEEMVRGAVNQALDRVRKLAAEETSRMAANLGLPLGMGLPGMPAGLAGLTGGEEEG